MSKPIVVIYVNPDSESTKLLNQFLARHIDQINKYIYIHRINVTNENVNAIRKKGIDRTPTLVYNNKKYVNLENIIKVLKPPTENKDNFGFGNTGPDELIHEYHNNLILKKEDDEDDDVPENRTKEIQQKMTALQKRRPRMDDGPMSESKSLGGRKSKSMGNNSYSSFDSDDDFRRASKVDQITETPVKRFMDDEDGAIMLEDYYLDMAKETGLKRETKSRRRSSY